MTDTNLSSEARLREQLSGLRDKWRQFGPFKPIPTPEDAIKVCAEELEAVIAAHPAGVEPPAPHHRWPSVRNKADTQKLRDAAPQPVQPSDPSRGRDNHGDRISALVKDWKAQIALRECNNDKYQCGVKRGLEMAVSDVESPNAMACPECGSENYETRTYDFGVDRETGYRNDGVRARCLDCGIDADIEDFQPKAANGDSATRSPAQSGLPPDGIVHSTAEYVGKSTQIPAPPQPEGERISQRELEARLSEAHWWNANRVHHVGSPTKDYGVKRIDKLETELAALAATPTPATPRTQKCGICGKPFPIDEKGQGFCAPCVLD